MSKTRQRRPRSTANVNGTLIHSQLNQEVYHEAHLCLVNRINLGPNEPFNGNTAQDLIQKNFKKRQSHGEVYMLEKEIVVEKNKKEKNEPFRNRLSYKEMVDLHISTTKPEFFCLGVHTLRDRRYYEIYKCKTIEATRKVVQYIRKARSDPEFKLRNEAVLRQRPFQPDQNRARSISVLEFQTPGEPIEEPEYVPPIRTSVPASIGNSRVTYIEYDPNKGVDVCPFASRYIFSSNDIESRLDLNPNSGNVTFVPNGYA